MNARKSFERAGRACRGRTRREALKVGALSVLGGLFQTPRILAVDGSLPRYRLPVRAKSVVLIYLQGGPPTQDMFDLKPDAPKASAANSSRSRRAHRAFRCASCFRSRHNGCTRRRSCAACTTTAAATRTCRCTRALTPISPTRNFATPTRRAWARSARTWSATGRECCLHMCICPVRWVGAKRARRRGPHGGFLGRTYDPFCTECTAFVDHPPDDMWKPQVVRGEPHLGSTGLPAEVTLDRLRDRRRLVDQLDRPFAQAPRRRRSGRLSQASTPGVRDAFLGRGARSLRSEPRRPYPARALWPHACLARRRSWRVASSSGACGSSTLVGTITRNASR